MTSSQNIEGNNRALRLPPPWYVQFHLSPIVLLSRHISSDTYFKDGVMLNIDHSNVIYAARSRHMQQGMEAQTLRGGADIWRGKSELLHTGVQ